MTMVEQRANYTSPSDALVLEDESGRVLLTAVPGFPLATLTAALVTGVVVAVRGTVTDAGELEVAGRKVVRILVTRKLTDTFSLLVDAETYFIVARIEHRNSVSGRRVEIVTRYEDYRPVDGVLVPHKVAVLSDGKIVQHTVIENVEANPSVTAETFVRPQTVPTQKP
jgi:hypothetical protein